MRFNERRLAVGMAVAGGIVGGVLAFFLVVVPALSKNEPTPPELTCAQRLERDEQHLSFRVSTPGQYLERHSNTMRFVRQGNEWHYLGEDYDECRSRAEYEFSASGEPNGRISDRYYACIDSMRAATTVVMDIAGPDTLEAMRTKIWLTGLSPEMAAARIATQKDSMYCSWVRMRRQDCVEEAKRDSVRAWVAGQGGAYKPCEGVCGD